MSEELEVIRDITHKLESAKISFMITGSIALNYYAVSRMTRGIDIVIEIDRNNVGQMERLFSNEYFIDHSAMEDAINHNFMFNIIHQIYIVKVDFIIRKNEQYRLLEFNRRKLVSFGDFKTWIVLKEDLILSKLYWAKDTLSELQFSDIRSLLVTEYDEKYLTHWIQQLHLQTVFEKCTNE